VTTGPRGDIENSHRAILAVHFRNKISQSFIQIRFAFPNSAPADAIQIRFVDQPTEWAPAMRFVFVNVIERKAGIETMAPADLDASTQSTRKFQSSTSHGKSCSAIVL